MSGTETDLEMPDLPDEDAKGRRNRSIMIWVTAEELARIDDRMRMDGGRRRGKYARALLLGEDGQAAGERRPLRPVPTINLQQWAELRALADAIEALSTLLAGDYHPDIYDRTELRCCLSDSAALLNTLRLALLGVEEGS